MNLMSHSSGLSGWDDPLTNDDLYDWDKVTSLLAAQEPWWKPGAASGYHAMTQGYLLGEVVRRVTGKTLGRFFRDHIAAPLDADFHIGLDPAHDHRVGELIPPENMPSEMTRSDDSIAARSLVSPPLDPRASMSEAWRRAEIDELHASR